MIDYMLHAITDADDLQIVFCQYILQNISPWVNLNILPIYEFTAFTNSLSVKKMYFGWKFS